MKNLVIKTAKTIWHWLTVERYIEFGTVEEEEQTELQESFAKYQTANFVKLCRYRIIMKKLVKFERDLELSKSGLLLTDDEARKRALETFRRAKQTWSARRIKRTCREGNQRD